MSLFPTLTRCWTRIGQQRVIRTPGVHAPKCWDWGAVDIVSGRTLHRLHPRRNNVGLRRLLAAISRAYELTTRPQRKVIVFVDNDKAHYARSVRRLVDKFQGQIKLEYLAPYAPELNPQEDIWQHMRRKVTHNYYFEHMERLVAAVDAFHDELQAHPQQVLQLISKWTHFIAA